MSSLEKQKMLKKPKFELGKLMELHGEVVVLEKLLGVRQVLKLNRMMDTSHRSKNLFKMQTFNGDKRSYLWFKKKEKKFGVSFLHWKTLPQSPFNSSK